MKTWKLVSGILSLVASALVLFQSCAAGMYNTLESNREVSGSRGFLVAIMMIAGGIVSIVTRNGSKGGSIAICVLYGLGALVGFAMAGSFTDLNIWAGWCLICAVLGVVSIFKGRKNKKAGEPRQTDEGEKV